MTIKCRGEELLLCKEKAIYWKAKNMLIISDLHIGKTAFFRKSGIQVPSGPGLADIHTLSLLIETYNPEELLITGDMFHNYMNEDVQQFAQWRAKYPDLKVRLIKGNHDALKAADYAQLNLLVAEKEVLLYPFRFIHEQPKLNDEYYCLSGHIHPGITVFGRARQHLRFPCFYFGKDYAILPAFSKFTGLSMIKPLQGDRVFAITPNSVLAL
ncbi:ligase-associated DNA damage response endonuclease PdeM [Pedobacter sp.]|uniref:ligase-associated DNA damage response endonuclease PdeM n=1 Tax=Pedobacter sp. TaxID=1411316 RepID=UPI003D7FA324